MNQPQPWFCYQCGHQNQPLWNACQQCQTPNPHMPVQTTHTFQKKKMPVSLIIFIGFCAICGLCGVLGKVGQLSSLQSKSQSSLSTSTAPVAETSRVASKEDALSKVKLDFKWGTGGFNSVMMVNFTITNESKYNIKDIEITCTHYANSGTKIDDNTRTIYELIPAGKKKVIRNFNMGFIHNQASSSSCKIANLVVE